MAAIPTTTQPASTSSLKQIIARHPLIAYFVLAFGGSGGVQLPMLLSQDGFGLLPYTVPLLPFMLLFLLSTYARPALAALVITATESGRAGVRAFLRRFVSGASVCAGTSWCSWGISSSTSSRGRSSWARPRWRRWRTGGRCSSPRTCPPSCCSRVPRSGGKSRAGVALRCRACRSASIRCRAACSSGCST